MAIGCWESFTGHNWERYANISGQLTSVLVIFFAIMTWLFKYNIGVGVYTFFFGLFMLWLETPLVDWIGPCFKCKTSFVEFLFLKNPAVRGVVFICASILMFMYHTPCIGAGIFLIFTALLKFFAQCNATSDAANGLNTGLNSDQTKSSNIV